MIYLLYLHSLLVLYVTIVDNAFKAADSRRKDRKAVLFDVTGVFGAVCARHNVPLKIVNMTGGEAYGIEIIYSVNCC